jgi:signal transduction histidine kinase
MKWLPRSLSGRLLLAATLLIVVALLSTAALTYVILDRFMHRQIDQQLDAQILVLRGALTSDGARLGQSATIDGPPFDRPLSGWYWQIVSTGGILRSASLAGLTLAAPKLTLPPPPPPPPPDSQRPPPPPFGAFGGPPPVPGDGLGPESQLLHFRSKAFHVGSRVVTITATAPQDAFAGPLRQAMAAVLLALIITAITLISAMVFQVQLGLKPLQALRRAVAEVRAGRADRLPGGQPTEIAPLAEELNKLIEDNADGLARARRHVANLAHGLKTPLANLSLALQGRGDNPELQSLVALMDRRIRHHLARARAAALNGPARVQTVLAPRIADVVAALSQIHAQRAISTEITADPNCAVHCEPQDLDEMLGNLIDNAFKWATSRVRVWVRSEGPNVSIVIEDDGPGLSAEVIDEVMQPGRRLDEQAPGYGFGLPIARELAELYGGGLALGRASIGGLCSTLTLPAAQ